MNQEPFVVENDTEIMTEPEERVENVSDLVSIEIDNEDLQKTDFDGNKNNSKKPERKCEICKMCLSSKNSLKQHINGVHLKIKPFQCKLCKKYFSEKQHLKRHNNGVHLKLKNFQCKRCKKYFSRNEHLQHHINSIHSKMKPFQCETCDNFLSCKSDLKKHVNRVHLKLKPNRNAKSKM